MDTNSKPANEAARVFCFYEIAPVVEQACGTMSVTISGEDARQSAEELGTPMVWGVYGLDGEGLAEHIADRNTEADALALLAAITGKQLAATDQRQILQVRSRASDCEALAAAVSHVPNIEKRLAALVQLAASGEAALAIGEGLLGQVDFLSSRGLQAKDVLSIGGVKVS